MLARQSARIRDGSALLWVWWVASTTIVTSLSYFAAGAIVALHAQSDALDPRLGGLDFMTGDNTLRYAVIWGFLLLILVGPSTGLVQGLVLLRILGYEDWKKWSLATALGISAALVLANIEICGFLLAGLAIGFLQWNVLRRSVRNAEFWILSVVVALGLGLAIGAFVALSYLPKSWLPFPSTAFYPMSAVVYWTCAWSVGIFVFAAVTGLTLIWLLRKRQQFNS